MSPGRPYQKEPSSIGSSLDPPSLLILQKYFPLKTHISLLIMATASKFVSHLSGKLSSIGGGGLDGGLGDSSGRGLSLGRGFRPPEAPYKCWIAWRSSGGRSKFCGTLVYHGYINDSLWELCDRPSEWPNSCTATANRLVCS